jgi:dynein heavy chain 1
LKILDEKIGTVLLDRLNDYLQLWHENNLQDIKLDLEIKVKNQAITVEPSISECRSIFYESIQKSVDQICGLKRISSSRYEQTASLKLNYSGLIHLLQFDRIFIVYDHVEDLLSGVEDHLKKWLRYQSLWEMNSESLYSGLGSDLAKWKALLLELNSTRTMIDKGEAFVTLGPITLKYEAIISKIGLKYENWQKETMQKFASLLLDSSSALFQSVASSRDKLEKQSVESGSIQEIVKAILFIQESNANIISWNQDVDLFYECEKILERQRFKFPSDWLFMECLSSEFACFQEILSRRNKMVESKMGMHLLFEPFRIACKENIKRAFSAQ